jgi:hypothetical protein
LLGDITTWEHYYVLKHKYLDAALWETEADEVLAQEGSSVRSADRLVENELPAQLEHDLTNEDEPIGQAEIK